MANSHKNIARNIMWSVIALAVNTILSFWLTPYITKNIGLDAYGYITLGDTFISYLEIVSVALNSFAGKYISMHYYEEDYKSVKKYFSSVLIANIVLSVVILLPSITAIKNVEILLLIKSGLVEEVQVMLFFVLLRYVITLVSTVYNVSLFIKNRLDISSRLNAVFSILKACIVILLYYFAKPHIWYLAISALVVCILNFVFNYFYTKKLTPELRYEKDSLDFSSIKSLLSNGIWNSINSIGNLLNSGLDLLVSNQFLGAAELGNLSVVKKISTLSSTLINQIALSIRPKQVEAYAKKDITSLIKYLNIAIKITGAVSCTIFICFVNCGLDFFKIWVPNLDGILLYNISLIVLIGDIVVGIVTPLFYVYTLTDKLKIPCIITIMNGLANVFSEMWLVTHTNWGIFAIVITTAILNFVLNFIFTPIYSAKCLGITRIAFYPIILKSLFFCFTLSSLSFVFTKDIFIASNALELILKAGFTCMFVIICFLFVFFDSYERARIKDTLVRRVTKR